MLIIYHNYVVTVFNAASHSGKITTLSMCQSYSSTSTSGSHIFADEISCAQLTDVADASDVVRDDKMQKDFPFFRHNGSNRANTEITQLPHDHIDLLSHLLNIVGDVHKMDEKSSSLMMLDYDSDLCELKSAMSHLMELDQVLDVDVGVMTDMMDESVSVIVDDMNSYKMIGPVIEG